MPYRSPGTVPVSVLVAIASISISAQTGSAAETKSQAPSLTAPSPLKIAQTPDAERQRRLEEQREAERVLIEGERLKREVRENNNGGGSLERQVGEEVNKVRESGADPQKVRAADTELNRLRQQNNRNRYNYDPFNYPYFTSPVIIFTPGSGNPNTQYQVPGDNRDRVGQDGSSPAVESSRNVGERNSTQILGSAGLKDNKVSPGIGIRFNNIGFEIAGIFNQDSLPGNVNDFSIPNNFLFDDLGIKKLSPQWGGDVLGFFEVAPKLSLYGSVGIYFQNLARIAQSQANTNNLYKQTNETNVAGAVGGGVTYSPGENVSVGLGYHSLRGVTAQLGISF